MRVSFAIGTIWGYQFAPDGRVLARKSYTFKRSSSASSTGPVTRSGHPGLWLPIVDGIYAGYDVELTAGVTAPMPALEVSPTPPPDPDPTPDPGTLWDPLARQFAASSRWNTPLPASIQPHPSSASMIAKVVLVSIDVTQYTYPLYYAEPGAALWTITATGRAATHEPTGERTDHSDKKLQVPLPAGALPAAGTDGQIVVIDRATGDEYDMWQVHNIDPNTKTATCSNETRYKGAMYGPGTTSPVTYWSQGAGLPYSAGLIRPHEMAAGRIPHALQILGNWTAPTFVYPATKSDGNDSSGIPEGSTIYIPASYDIATMKDRNGAALIPEAKIIARALQEFGAIVVDTSGNTGKIRAESNLTAQWPTLPSASWVRLPSSVLRVAAP